MRCQNCGTFVHPQAFHAQDKLTSFLVGEGPMQWAQAYNAVENVRILSASLQIMSGFL